MGMLYLMIIIIIVHCLWGKRHYPELFIYGEMNGSFTNHAVARQLSGRAQKEPVF